MAVRKLKNSWWVDFTFNHRRHRKRSPENSRAGAEAYEIALRQRLARGERLDGLAVSTQNDLTFKEFVKQWFEDYVKPNNKFSEQVMKKSILSSSLVPFFGQIPVGQIKSHDIERYKAEQAKLGLTNKTIRNRLTVLNKCLATAYDWLELEGAPPKVKWPKCTLPEIDYLSPEECDLLLSSAHGVIQEMVLTALRTGMRLGELVGLQWSSIDWLNRSLAVRHSQDNRQKVLVAPKNNRTRHIPLDVDVYETLYRRKSGIGYVFLANDGRPFNNYRLWWAMRRLCNEAGMRKIGWHTLRHTFASHLAMRGVPLPAIKELMGHSSVTTTMRYAHVAPSTLRSAIEILNPKTMVSGYFGQPGVNQWQEVQKAEALRKAA